MSLRPIIAWSYSALSTYENCPRKYWATKVEKLVDDRNKFSIRGDDEHKSIETYMKTGAGLAQNLDPIKPVFDKLRSAPGDQYVEYQMTLDRDMTPCRWNDWNRAWVRGAGDYVKVNGTHATYIDWKSGKPRKDTQEQIELVSLLLFRHFENVKTVSGSMFYYRHGKITPPHVVAREQEPQLWDGFIRRVKEMEQSKVNDNWPTNPNPLCGWCPYTACPHNKQAERLKKEAARNGQHA